LWATAVAVTVLLPPLELMVILLEKLPAAPEENRTTTSCGWPGKSEKLPPDMMLNGAGALTVPVSVPPPPFQMTNDACTCWLMNVWGRVKLVVDRLTEGVRLRQR
jgi:hypothetical protein